MYSVTRKLLLSSRKLSQKSMKVLNRSKEVGEQGPALEQALCWLPVEVSKVNYQDSHQDSDY